MDNLNLVASLKAYREFDSETLFNAFKMAYGEMSLSSYKLKKYKMIDAEIIARVGRNAYCVLNQDIKQYDYKYSGIATKVQKAIADDFQTLDYTIFESFQLNEFLNHQIAHNTIFVSVESNLGDFVFANLRCIFPGKVLLNPTLKEFALYANDNSIIVNNLISESPFWRKKEHYTKLEKMLVDISADRIIRSIFSDSEFPSILESAFKRYAIDESQMFRYARRRHVEDRILQIIKNDTKIELRKG